MELIPTSWNRYWRRNRYQRLNEAPLRKRNIRVARLGGGGGGGGERLSPGRLGWRIKVVAKVRLRVVVTAPLKLVARLKNNYVDMMVKLAGSVGSLNTNRVFGNKRIPKARQLRMSCSDEEFRNRIIYEMFKNVSAAHELAPL
ncbi:hypothetical protein LINGRAHAP2_LOCUS30974 [Linum grandiflorum]